MDLIDLISDDEYTNSRQAHVPDDRMCSPITSPSSRSSFYKDSDGNIIITRNLKASLYQVCSVIPQYFDTTETGVCSFVRLSTDVPDMTTNGSDDYVLHRVCNDTSFSLRFQPARRSTVLSSTGSGSHPVIRKTAVCRGIKCCVKSLPICSKETRVPAHTGDILQIAGREGSTARGNYVDQEFELARQVFFFAQAHFPVQCKHHGLKTPRSATMGHEEKQTRLPNWVFRPGKVLYQAGPTSCKSMFGTSRLPDFIGCCHFGKPGVRDPQRCDIRTLPPTLQNCNGRLVADLIHSAYLGNPPLPSASDIDKCPPLSRATRSKLCQRGVHGYEVSPLQVIPCNVKYHYLFDNSGCVPKWVLVIGVGTHTHARPPLRPSPAEVRNVVARSYLGNNHITTGELCEEVRSTLRKSAPHDSVRTLHRKLLCESFPYGRSLSSLLERYLASISSDKQEYIIDVIDEREADKHRCITDQVGVVVLLCNEGLLKRCVPNPFFGCDGTFSTVQCKADGLVFELTSIVAKDLETGRIYSVMRQLSSRKTVAARKVLFSCFLKKLRILGVEDPLLASPSNRISFSTDFETTFGIAFCQALTEVFRPDDDMGDIWETYVRLVCFGCDVHAKRAILGKLNITDQHHLYTWAIGTRSVSYVEQVDEALTTMLQLGGKWASFASWINGNKVAHVLWFQVFHKQGWRSHPQQMVMWSTNGNESMHARIKGTTEYLMTNGQGLPALSLVNLLERLDTTDLSNLIGGMQYTSIPLWRRSLRLKKRKLHDDKIVIDGHTVHASEPKRSKISSSVFH